MKRIGLECELPFSLKNCIQMLSANSAFNVLMCFLKRPDNTSTKT